MTVAWLSSTFKYSQMYHINYKFTWPAPLIAATCEKSIPAILILSIKISRALIHITVGDVILPSFESFPCTPPSVRYSGNSVSNWTHSLATTRSLPLITTAFSYNNVYLYKDLNYKFFSSYSKNVINNDLFNDLWCLLPAELKDRSRWKVCHPLLRLLMKMKWVTNKLYVELYFRFEFKANPINNVYRNRFCKSTYWWKFPSIRSRFTYVCLCKCHGCCFKTNVLIFL